MEDEKEKGYTHIECNNSLGQIHDKEKDSSESNDGTFTRILPEHPESLIKDMYNYNRGKWTYETTKPESCISNQHQTALCDYSGKRNANCKIVNKIQSISDKSGTNNSRKKKKLEFTIFPAPMENQLLYFN